MHPLHFKSEIIITWYQHLNSTTLFTMHFIYYILLYVKYIYFKVAIIACVENENVQWSFISAGTLIKKNLWLIFEAMSHCGECRTPSVTQFLLPYLVSEYKHLSASLWVSVYTPTDVAGRKQAHTSALTSVHLHAAPRSGDEPLCVLFACSLRVREGFLRLLWFWL